MSSANLAGPRETFGGEMSDGELAFLGYVRDLVRAALDGRLPFGLAVVNLLTELRELPRSRYTVASGWKPTTPVTALVDGASAHRITPSALERAFLEDVEGLIDFAIRNGVSFLQVVSALFHDLNEISAHELSLERAVKESFVRPHVTGWAQRNRATVGEAEGGTE